MPLKSNKRIWKNFEMGQSKTDADITSVIELMVQYRCGEPLQIELLFFSSDLVQEVSP